MSAEACEECGEPHHPWITCLASFRKRLTAAEATCARLREELAAKEAEYAGFRGKFMSDLTAARRSLEAGRKLVAKFADAADSEEELAVIHELTAWAAPPAATPPPCASASGCGRAWNSRDGLTGYVLRNSNAWCSIECADAGRHRDAGAPRNPVKP